LFGLEQVKESAMTTKPWERQFVQDVEKLVRSIQQYRPHTLLTITLKEMDGTTHRIAAPLSDVATELLTDAD
jgi:hypothetical protein